MTVDFAREVLPVLSDKCFVCHGPDTHDDTDLRLDSQAAAARDLGGYHALDLADPLSSEILARIHSEDDPMPPSDFEKRLTKSERELISRWIGQGGSYAQHWAFVRPRKQVAYDNATSAIDGLVEKQLRASDIRFAPPANRTALARRVALVLTGLPPEANLLDQFIADEPGGAYERLVDRLLASPRFGEHQARYWLDAVRYGDTHGLHLDNRRGIYPYRDWVVRAFNENLPLDDFITWQVAGDLLPDASLEQKVATGFVRMNPSTGEGGALAEEFQMKNNFDRVETFGTVFLGMSLTCARCHTHKYDPIEQSEYYRLMAFFNSTAEPALDGNSYTYGPVAQVPADQDSWQRWRVLRATREERVAAIESRVSDFAAALEYAVARAGWSSKDWRMTVPAPRSDYSLKTDPAWQPVKGLPGAISGRAAKGKLPGDDQFVWVTFEVETPQQQTIDLTFNGAAGTHVLVDGRNVPVAEKQTSDRVSIASLHLMAGTHQVRIGVFGAADLAELEIRLDNRWDPLAKSKQWSSCTPGERLRMLADRSGPLWRPEWGEGLAELDRELALIEANFTTTLIARELSEARPTKLLVRGEYDRPIGDALQPGILQVMSPFPPQAPRNRLGLARWLTSPEHPLVTRVLVNRLWQRTFGSGLVRTPEDFGLQGQQPTHPQLLDWLAVDLQETGWDMKRLLRSMVLSRAFRQSSAWRDEVDDPENRLLARGASYRLDAEVLRDLGLWSSGLLDSHMGGEGVKPYQPVGMWAALAHPASNTKAYQRDAGKRLYRRSLYVYWKRTSPHPMMTLFDAPDRESSCVRRSRTNTPLQSLGLFNETQRVEIARSFGGLLINQHDDDSARINELFRRLTCRNATDQEQNLSKLLLKQMRRRYRDDLADAKKLLAIGESASDSRLDPAEHAAWTQLAATILASDVAILMY